MQNLEQILNEEKSIWIKKNYQEWLEFFKDDYFFRELKGSLTTQYWINLHLLEREEDRVHVSLLVVFDEPLSPGDGNSPMSTDWLVYKDGRIDA